MTNELSHSDEGLSDADDTVGGSGTGEFKIKPLSGRSNRLSYPFPSRNKSQSSPSLLPINEPITEENESENEDESIKSRHMPNHKRIAMRRNTFSNSGNGTPTACRLSPIHSRRSSYSSSDDDDSHKILSHSTSSPPLVQTANNSSSNQQQKQSDTNSNNSNSRSSAIESPLMQNNINTSATERLGLSYDKFTKTRVDNSNTNKGPSKATSMDNLSAKMLSLLMEDLEQVSKKTSSDVMLRNLVNNAYGRHLSDTNLTTYSMQLQMALATEKMKNCLLYTSPSPRDRG